MIGDLQIEGICAGGLNYKPYSTPGMTRVNTSLPESNPLFKQEAAQMNPDENLQMKSQKKVWGQPTPAPAEPVKPTPEMKSSVAAASEEQIQLNKPGT